MSTKTKHNHLRRKALELHAKYDDKKVEKMLGLTSSELKSCLTAAWKDPKLKSIPRRDTRKSTPWSNSDLEIMLGLAGIISRDEINDIIKRGKTGRAIKEKLRSLNISSKNLNGLSISQFRAIFNSEPINFIQTTAGPPSNFSHVSGAGHFKIVLWVEILKMVQLELISCSDVFHIHVKTMAIFQRWVLGDYPYDRMNYLLNK